MTTQSDAPPNATDNKRQNSGAEITQPTNMDQQNATEPVKQSSATSVFVNSQPMREEQVQNAVKFLSHPKVKGSPIIYRRSFLEQKGLTKEEIDEAFRRVPDSPPSVQTAGVNQDGQLRPSPNVQQQVQPQTLQPGASVSTVTTPSSGTLSRYRFHWSHGLIAVGLLAASGAGTAVLIKNSILPRLKSWIRKVVIEDEDDQLKRTDSKPTLAEEATQAAKEAAAAAAEMAKVSQEMLASKSEERRYFEVYASHLDEQAQQLKLMTNAIKRLEASSGAPLSKQEYRLTQGSSKHMQQVFVNGGGEYDMRSVRSSSPPASVEPAAAPPSKSYTDMTVPVQRGERERPSNIRPWEPGLVQRSYNEEHRTLVNDEELISMANTIQSNGKDLISMAQDTFQSNGDAPSPWWQRKNVRIQEIENEYEHNAAPYSAQSSEQPVRRSWIPPQPPPIAMAEAAEAIRRPKPSVPREQVSDDQSVAHSSDTSDEMQRTPQISEPEGAIEAGSVKYGEVPDGEAKYEESNE
ncbi:peroxisomal membrane protein PEX14-like isoform X2 [Prosopis cineraria]|uniref:peroxisomal membrane protein PEX14-like isoform X2 n=1 Tax=Prosopis cineraria TaxID=364024 RepID=UPI00240FE2D3|nr:peroxisomal membrane protein PEX14-like isoform X2 [Prosopis cineraria]XP_054822439.1 peroxisomal membrane protein PEX14-like isoform X2 [Prosopis cineraria]